LVTEIKTVSGTAEGPRSLRIVVADDDPDQVITLVTLLRHEGHEVFALHRGAHLLQTVEEFRPDVLIIDLKLPDASGFDIAEEIRARFGRRLLLIAISGVYKKEGDRVITGLVGFDHHLIKPFAIDELLRLLEPMPGAASRSASTP
jgi:DNA-binding response OmpR family regulator